MRFSLLVKTCLGVALSVMTSLAVAQELTLDQGPIFSPDYDNGGMGSGRGLGFHADENFSMTTFAIDLSVPSAEASATYQFEIYDSTDGHTAGVMLASTSFNLYLGEGYQPQPFVYDFVAGNYYVIHFSRVDDEQLGQLGTKYSWESGFVPYDYGILTVVEGFGSSADPTPGNPLIPHVQFNGEPVVQSAPVPTLSTWALAIMLTLLGLMVFTRRKYFA